MNIGSWEFRDIRLRWVFEDISLPLLSRVGVVFGVAPGRGVRDAGEGEQGTDR